MHTKPGWPTKGSLGEDFAVAAGGEGRLVHVVARISIAIQCAMMSSCAPHGRREVFAVHSNRVSVASGEVDSLSMCTGHCVPCTGQRFGIRDFVLPDIQQYSLSVRVH
jgi:hypothetical protein